MPTLILNSAPGFTDIADSTFDAGNPVTAAVMKALNANAKFDAVRTEEFQGYYKHGETIVLPVSQADAYAYAREELIYTFTVFWTGAPPSTPLLGDAAPPARGATSGPGHLLEFGFFIDAATGFVSCDVHYHRDGGAQTNTNDGILFVTTHAKRQR